MKAKRESKRITLEAAPGDQLTIEGRGLPISGEDLDRMVEAAREGRPFVLLTGRQYGRTRLQKLIASRL